MRCDRLLENLAWVRERIRRSASHAARSPDAVRLVAVTKQVDVEVAEALVEAGVADLGESRPQELWRKQALVARPVRWHLIGPLQRNKARHTLPIAHLIHSADSVRLLDWLDELAGQLGLVSSVLLEVNVSGEVAKHGLRPDELPAVLEQALRWSRLQIHGLMTMAPYDASPEHARAVFAVLRELRDRVRSNAPPNCPLDELSMGMSGDFEAAVAEGATIVRIGSALFRGIEVAG